EGGGRGRSLRSGAPTPVAAGCVLRLPATSGWETHHPRVLRRSSSPPRKASSADGYVVPVSSRRPLMVCMTWQEYLPAAGSGASTYWGRLSNNTTNERPSVPARMLPPCRVSHSGVPTDLGTPPPVLNPQ